ncbi:MAG: hypothetical protein V1655_01275 [bacterium]
MLWSDEEELAELFFEGRTARELAKIFQRKEGAISSRLRKIGVVAAEG